MWGNSFNVLCGVGSTQASCNWKLSLLCAYWNNPNLKACLVLCLLSGFQTYFVCWVDLPKDNSCFFKLKTDFLIHFWLFVSWYQWLIIGGLFAEYFNVLKTSGKVNIFVCAWKIWHPFLSLRFLPTLPQTGLDNSCISSAFPLFMKITRSGTFIL